MLSVVCHNGIVQRKSRCRDNEISKIQLLAAHRQLGIEIAKQLRNLRIERVHRECFFHAFEKLYAGISLRVGRSASNSML